MSASASVTLAIGRNIGDAPMPDADWRRFQRSELAALEAVGADIHAHAEGFGTDELGAREETALIAATVPVACIDVLARELGDIGHHYGQRCVALTVGEVRFPGA